MLKSRHYIAVPPGETIKEQLEMRGMSRKEFARLMDMSECHMRKLLNGETELTQELALKLESVIEIPAKFWNNLEAIYRERILRVNEENSKFGMLPDDTISEELIEKI